MPTVHIKGEHYDGYGRFKDKRDVLLYRGKDDKEVTVEVTNRTVSIKITDLLKALEDLGVDLERGNRSAGTGQDG